jgi:hypothetical protein
MSIQQFLISEISQQPEPLLAKDESQAAPTTRPGFGSVPGIKLADDIDAPLEAFADHRPSGLAGE